MTLEEAVALVPPGCDWSINSRHYASVWEAEKGLHWWTVQDDNVVEALAKAAKQARVALGIDPDSINPDFRAGVERLRDLILELLRKDPSLLVRHIITDDAIRYGDALVSRVAKIADELLKTE